LLREAEGYLELGLPQSALNVLDRMGEPGTYGSRQLYLRGEAYRAQDRFAEAIAALEEAAERTPSKIDIYLALGWCYKRTGRLDLAIESLEKGLEVEPGTAILHYNLACYWSLSGGKDQALTYLSEALRIDAHYRDLIAGETDFDPLRGDPDFQALLTVTV
jgi:tetratricopeptide (TPR) repeat protein